MSHRLVGTWAGMERESISFTDGEEPAATIGGTEVNFSAYRGGDGSEYTG